MPKFLGFNVNYSRTTVIDFLIKIELPKKTLSSERELENFLFKKLSAKFPKIDRQKGLDSSNGMKIDIDLGHGEIGIEIKLAEQLVGNASKRKEAIGQLVQYRKMYETDLILIVGGKKTEGLSPLLREVQENTKSVGARYIFLSAK